jgi:signal transduction histidine kinase
VVPSRVRKAFTPPWVDLLAAGTCFTGGALLYLADHAGAGVTGDGPDAVPLEARLGLLAVACAGQALRRRAPVAALLLAGSALAADAVLGLRLPVLVLVLADVVYAATAYGAAWLSRLLVRGVVGLTLALVAVAWVLADSWRSALWVAAQIVVVLPTPVWWGAGIRHHRELAAAERRRAEGMARVAELDRRAAVAAERARMARDLHDVVAGHLSAIALQSEAVLSGAGRDPERERAVMHAVRENSLQALTEMRAMIDLLRDDGREAPDDASAPRLAGLDRLVTSARAAGLRVAVDGEPPPGLPAAVDAAAYRILQEALTNAVSHAPRGEARVGLATADGMFVLEVTNGLARTPALATGAGGAGAAHRGAGTGTGLPSMRTRAEEVGGTLSAGAAGGRWRVRAELPLEPA